MKIYKFYLKKKVIHPRRYPSINEDNIFINKNGKYYCMYGYTEDKKIRDEFIKYRDMNIFKIKTEDMRDEEYKEYMEKHIDEYLEYNSFITSDVYNHKRRKSVVLVTTHKEYTIIENDCDMIAEKSLYNIIEDIKNKDNIYDIVINFQSIFKHDITEALYILEFSNIMIEYLMPDEFKLPFKIYDEDKLMAYVKVFGNTYKKGR